MRAWNTFVGAAITAVLATAGSAQNVDFQLSENLKVKDAEIPYELDLTLSAVGPTRIGVDAMLDLRDFQQQLPALAAGEIILNLCGNESTITKLRVEAEDQDLSLLGQVQSKFFECDKVNETTFERGVSRFDLNLDVTARASVDLASNCIVFKLVDLAVQPHEQILDFQDGSENLEAARALLVAALDLILAERPFCPKLPPELAALDPIYNEGGPRELGDGGVGIFLRGSVDVGPQTIVDILNVLQDNGIIPGRP